MKTGIRRRLSPEEEELAKKRGELALMQTQLGERELYLADLRADSQPLREGIYDRLELDVEEIRKSRTTAIVCS